MGCWRPHFVPFGSHGPQVGRGQQEDWIQPPVEQGDPESPLLLPVGPKVNWSLEFGGLSPRGGFHLGGLGVLCSSNGIRAASGSGL